MTGPFRPTERFASRPLERTSERSTAGLSVADRRLLTRLVRDVGSIRRWVAFFGVLVVCSLLGGASLLVVLVGDAAGWWATVMR